MCPCLGTGPQVFYPRPCVLDSAVHNSDFLDTASFPFSLALLTSRVHTGVWGNAVQRRDMPQLKKKNVAATKCLVRLINKICYPWSVVVPVVSQHSLVGEGLAAKGWMEGWSDGWLEEVEDV